MNFVNYINTFIVGGLICVAGQILIDKTKISTSRIVVLFVIIGCILQAFGIYENLVNFAGAGATVPITGFGYVLVKGTIEEIDKIGFLGIITGGLKAASAGISSVIIFSFIASLIFNPKEKE